MYLLDYEVPLRASNLDTGLGEVDLLGATDKGRLVVVELKVRRKDNDRGDTPLMALMEGLRYAAVVHSNHITLRAEASDRFGIRTSDEPPIVQILAPNDWWHGWCDMRSSTRTRAGDWEREFAELSEQLVARLGIVIDCIALHGAGLADVVWDTDGPRLRNTPEMRRLDLAA